MFRRILFAVICLSVGAALGVGSYSGVSAAPVLTLPQDFLKLAAVIFPGDGLTGAPLAYADNGDGTFTDMATGRMWEKKVAGGGTCAGALHAVDATCTWAEATGTWIAKINAEGGTGLGGHDDWRVPTVKELQSLVDYSTSHPAVSAGFPGEVAASLYWSSTPSADFASFALTVSFISGNVFPNEKTEVHRVRAVRGGP